MRGVFCRVGGCGDDPSTELGQCFLARVDHGVDVVSRVHIQEGVLLEEFELLVNAVSDSLIVLDMHACKYGGVPKGQRGQPGEAALEGTCLDCGVLHRGLHFVAQA